MCWRTFRRWSLRWACWGDEFGAWAVSALGGSPTYDPVSGGSAVGGLDLAGGGVGGLAGRREERPLLALLPMLVALLAAEAYTAGPILPVMLALVGMLFSLAFGAQAPVERRALSTYVDLPEGLAFQLARLVLPLAVALALIGAAAPELSFETWIEQYRAWRQSASRTDQGLARSLGVELGAAPSRTEKGAENPGLPNRHLIGSGPELSHETVMLVSVKPVAGLPSPPPYYWRTATYDQYTGHGWQTSPVTQQALLAGELAIPALPVRHVEVRQAVHFVEPQAGRIFAAGELMGLDENYVAAWRSVGEDLFGATGPPGDYVATSAWPVNTPQELRQASSELPPWMEARFVRLPDGVPAEVIALARDLTATQPTVYDRALAIESYLRKLPYTLDVPPPPIDGDIVAYFLFSLKKGYCDYYASAMVVLARAAGIPARIAVGYASGQSDVLEDGSIRYTVTAADAHTWVEVYFPAYGWVPFEPTAGRPPLDRGQAAASPEPTGSGGQPAPTGGVTQAPNSAEKVLLVLAVVLGAVGVLAAAVVVLDQVRLRRLSAPKQAQRLMVRTRWLAARWLGVPVHVGDTPLEFEARLRSFVMSGRQVEAVGPVARRAISQLEELVQVYVKAFYRPELPNRSQLASMRRAWIWLSLRLVWLGVVMRTRRTAGRAASPDAGRSDA